MTVVILHRMKTAISIPDPLFKAADRAARRLGVSRSELYARALAEFLQARQSERVTEALNRVYRETPSALDPVLEALQEEVLRTDPW